MSLAGLVQYDSSDESDNEDISKSVNEINISNENKISNRNESKSNAVIPTYQDRKLILPEPIQKFERLEITDAQSSDNKSLHNLFLNNLPKPKNIAIGGDIEEENEEDDDDIAVYKAKQFVVEKPPKKEKGPVKISIPSLSDFDDMDETTNSKRTKPQPSKKLPGVLSLLPPPKGEAISTANFIPHVLTKATNKNIPSTPTQMKSKPRTPSNVKINTNTKEMKPLHALNSLNYDSNTDDEEDDNTKSTNAKAIDFFSLSEPINLPLSEEIVAANILPISANEIQTKSAEESTEVIENNDKSPTKTLTSTVMNLTKDEILLKNKAEVGPKLPVPEQQFNIDAEGNVAFDDKAIEYLCGKRGVKRKNEIINENEIIDINGEDMKPDEREWLVKALTENPVRKPASLGSGPSGQSKKKHQITYLAHQAKAMEIELQNQWASSNLARKQTRSKYGF